ncbi:MFS transporter [Streptomyces sp. VRA16 Mangrove soil]|uniref:MFS transporter n=1 Tax=Streptomyces sp. VRA16 Mangrove soil TaxID=2817434 RepID=UPI001A9F973E|nr:MFS transporter [Streptomyces sp. VRA16 Mangrove soil]MBO1333592.1 MFS transporter [Streptomyces sp. VRA16 Mangrove soil]
MRLGRDFGWLWAAFAASSAGTWLALDAFPLIAVLALGAGPAQVSFLAAAGLAAGAAFAVPLGPWVEFRRKRPVMIAADLVRCAALLTLPLSHALGALTFAQLVAVAVVVATADIVFRAASGAHLKALVPTDGLLLANSRFENVTWTTTALGPPLGGAAIGLFGPLATTLANAVSFLLSACGIAAIRAPEPAPADRRPLDRASIGAGWRHIWHSRRLRALFLNTTAVNGLIMGTAPLLTVLMVSDLGFPPWQYGLAFGGIPCVGGLIGSRLARPLAARLGEERLLLYAGAARALWLGGLAFIGPGPAGLTVAVLVELGLVTCCGVFNPVLATARLRWTAPDQIARVMASWSVTGNVTKAVLTLTWGALAAVVGTREAVAVAGALMLATPLLLLPRGVLGEPPEGLRAEDQDPAVGVL